MAKYVYPAIFTPEENGAFSIVFPDIENCFTCGDNLEDGINMAKDVLSLMLTQLEDKGLHIPEPTAINQLDTSNDSFATYIACDTSLYRRLMNNTAVKKTLTIPSWLNAAALEQGINFSQTLQEALLSKVHSS